MIGEYFTELITKYGDIKASKEHRIISKVLPKIGLEIPKWYGQRIDL